jgi:dienelactone hydrolase
VVHTASGPVEVAEAGEGPLVLVVHDAAGGFDLGLRVGADVLREGFRVIAPSRFGYLGTPMPTDASLDDWTCGTQPSSPSRPGRSLRPGSLCATPSGFGLSC